jgi:putative heme-binding domain-containing protein
MIDLRRGQPQDQTNALQVRPVQGSFDIPGAEILAPGDPYRSVLYYRMAKLGRGRMPHIGSEVVDEQGLRLIHDWIRQLPMHREERTLLERLRALDESAVLAHERQEAARQIRHAAREIARAAGRDKVTDADRKEAESRHRAGAAARVKQRGAERGTAIDRLLSSPRSALMLAEALDEGRVPASVRLQVLAAAQGRPEPVRDLFERFIPDEQRVARLGNVIEPAALLARKGDAARGRELFFKSASLCVNCHRVGGTGGTAGPDLSQIGKKYNRAQLLESILEPSKVIDPPYIAFLVETTDGKVHTGVVASRAAQELVLRDAEGKEIRIPTAKVEKMQPQKKSLMPELLLRDLTAEQAADLLGFLASLK